MLFIGIQVNNITVHWQCSVKIKIFFRSSAEILVVFTIKNPASKDLAKSNVEFTITGFLRFFSIHFSTELD